MCSQWAGGQRREQLYAAPVVSVTRSIPAFQPAKQRSAERLVVADASNRSARCCCPEWSVDKSCICKEPPTVRKDPPKLCTLLLDWDRLSSKFMSLLWCYNTAWRWHTVCTLLHAGLDVASAASIVPRAWPCGLAAVASHA